MEWNCWWIDQIYTMHTHTDTQIFFQTENVALNDNNDKIRKKALALFKKKRYEKKIVVRTKRREWKKGKMEKKRKENGYDNRKILSHDIKISSYFSFTIYGNNNVIVMVLPSIQHHHILLCSHTLCCCCCCCCFAPKELNEKENVIVRAFFLLILPRFLKFHFSPELENLAFSQQNVSYILHKKIK